MECKCLLGSRTTNKIQEKKEKENQHILIKCPQVETAQERASSLESDISDRGFKVFGPGLLGERAIVDGDGKKKMIAMETRSSKGNILELRVTTEGWVGIQGK